MKECFRLRFRVRDYELDQFGVVNNSVYLNYLEHCRHEFLVSIGIDPARMAREGRAIALSTIEVQFQSPLRSQELFEGAMILDSMSGVRVGILQFLHRLPGNEPVLQARATAVFLNEAGRPVRVPAWVREALTPHISPAE